MRYTFYCHGAFFLLSWFSNSSSNVRSTFELSWTLSKVSECPVGCVIPFVTICIIDPTAARHDTSKVRSCSMAAGSGGLLSRLSETRAGRESWELTGIPNPNRRLIAHHTMPSQRASFKGVLSFFSVAHDHDSSPNIQPAAAATFVRGTLRQTGATSAGSSRPAVKLRFVGRALFTSLFPADMAPAEHDVGLPQSNLTLASGRFPFRVAQWWTKHRRSRQK